MTIHWHKRAAAQLHQVEDYVLRDFGERIRQARHFKDRTKFWDTRREPKNQARQTK